MPKLPNPNENQRRLPTQTGNAIPSGDVTQSIRAFGNLAGQVQDIATGALQQRNEEFEKREKERETINYNNALMGMSQDLHVLENEIRDNEDYQSYSSLYQDGFQKAYDKYSGFVPDSMKSDFQMKSQAMRFKGGNKVNEFARARQSDVLRASILQQRDHALKIFEYSDDYEEGQQAALSFRESVNNNSVLDETEKVEIWQKFADATNKIKEDRIILKNELMDKETRRKSFKMDDGAVSGYVQKYSKKYNIPIDTTNRLIALESAGRINAKNPKSSASGIMQIMKDTAKELGVDPFDPEQGIEGGLRLARNNRKYLASKGINVQEWHTYLAHQQGMGGAYALLSNPNENAISVLERVYKKNKKIKNPAKRARDAVLLNKGREDMTAREFSHYWKRRFENVDLSALTYYSSVGEEVEKGLNLLPVNKQLQFITKRQKAEQKEEQKEREKLIADGLASDYPDDYEGQLGGLEILYQTGKIDVATYDNAKARINKYYSEQTKINKQRSMQALEEGRKIIMDGGLLSDVDENVIDNLTPKDFNSLRRLEKDQRKKIEQKYNFENALRGSEDHKKAVKGTFEIELAPVLSDPEISPQDKALQAVAFVRDARGIVPGDIVSYLNHGIQTPNSQHGEFTARFVEGVRLLGDDSAYNAIPDKVKNYTDIYKMNATLPPQEAAKIAYDSVNPNDVQKQERAKIFDSMLKDDDVSLTTILEKYGDQETVISDIFSNVRDFSDFEANNPQFLRMSQEFHNIMRHEFTQTNDIELASKRANEKMIAMGWGRDYEGRLMKHAPSAIYKVDPEFIERDFRGQLQADGIDFEGAEYSLYTNMDTERMVARGEEPVYMVMENGLPLIDSKGSRVMYKPSIENLDMMREEVMQEKVDELTSDKLQSKQALDRRARRAKMSVEDYLQREKKDFDFDISGLASSLSPYSGFEGDIKSEIEQDISEEQARRERFKQNDRRRK